MKTETIPLYYIAFVFGLSALVLLALESAGRGVF